jgi:hypothetical protein
MTTAPSIPSGPWRCPGCGSDRDAVDAFCGRCATPRPPGGSLPVDQSPQAGAPAQSHHDAQADAHPSALGGAERERSSSFPLRRALILNGIVIGAVVGIVLLSRSPAGSPVITFEPLTWRCDGTERAWLADIPASHPNLLVEWRSGGPDGTVRDISSTTRLALEAFQTPGGPFRVTTTSRTSPECGLPAGTYALVLRDLDLGVVVASGDVAIAAP